MTDDTKTGTDVTPFGMGKINLTNADAFVDALEKSAADNPRGMDGGDYISFSGKQGRYSIGVDKNDADPEEPMLVVLPSSQSGWICWKGGKPVEKRMARIDLPPVAVPDPTEHAPFNERTGEGWYKAKALLFYSLDRGVPGEFTNNSVSGVSEMAKLQEESAERFKEGKAFWPVVGLNKEKFSAQGQTNWKPVFDRMMWLTTEQVSELTGASSLEELQDMTDRMLEAGEVVPDVVDAIDGTSDAPVDAAEPAPRRRRRAAV